MGQVERQVRVRCTAMRCLGWRAFRLAAPKQFSEGRPVRLDAERLTSVRQQKALSGKSLDFFRKMVQARRVSTIYKGAFFYFSRHSTTFMGYRESVETARFLCSRATSASTFSDRRRQLDVARSRRPPSRFHDNETPTWRNSKSVRLSRVVGSANVSCPV